SPRPRRRPGQARLRHQINSDNGGRGGRRMTPAADAIYHLAPKSTWERSGTGPYRAASLDTEGFIHCSYREQVEWAANRFYANETDLFVLQIDPGRLTSPVRAEGAGNGQRFPHIYGPIDRQAVVDVQVMRRDP